MYRTGALISWKTTSAEPSPDGSGPASASATAGLAAVELDVGKPVSGATGPVDPSALALELGVELGLALAVAVGVFTEPGEPPPLLHAATASPAAAATVATVRCCRRDCRSRGTGQLSGV
jgi:hypothetical protein